jgi:hypothetical protein
LLHCGYESGHTFIITAFLGAGFDACLICFLGVRVWRFAAEANIAHEVATYAFPSLLLLFGITALSVAAGVLRLVVTALRFAGFLLFLQALSTTMVIPTHQRLQAVCNGRNSIRILDP